MKHLYQKFGTYNLSAYPDCIRLIIEAHKSGCFRREYGMKQNKMILMFPKTRNFDAFNQTINPENIDATYDHIIYENEPTLSNILKNAITNSNQDSIKSPTSDKQISVPSGIRISFNQTHEAEIYYCLNKWFKKEEVFWLRE